MARMSKPRCIINWAQEHFPDGKVPGLMPWQQKILESYYAKERVMHPDIEDTVNYFSHGHLKEGRIRDMSKVFGDFCADLEILVESYNHSPQLLFGFQHLLAAKDCFVRATVRDIEHQTEWSPIKEYRIGDVLRDNNGDLQMVSAVNTQPVIADEVDEFVQDDGKPFDPPLTIQDNGDIKPTNRSIVAACPNCQHKISALPGSRRFTDNMHCGQCSMNPYMLYANTCQQCGEIAKSPLQAIATEILTECNRCRKPEPVIFTEGDAIAHEMEFTVQEPLYCPYPKCAIYGTHMHSQFPRVYFTGRAAINT